MIGFLQSLFGMGETTGKRTVAGTSVDIEAKDIPYIRESKRRLTELHELVHRYKGTPHAVQLNAVYEKTKRIHTYLLHKQKGYELEMFHLQHTDHFLRTYTAIIAAQEEHRRANRRSATARAGAAVRRVASGLFKSDRKEVKHAQQRNQETSQRALQDLTQANGEVPKLTLPHISINTYAKIVYLQEHTPGVLSTHEIGFTSTTEEKAAFVNYVSDRLDLADISYMGNAMVYLPSHPQAAMVPVIHWAGCPYAVSLEDERLFPVRTYKESR